MLLVEEVLCKRKHFLIGYSKVAVGSFAMEPAEERPIELEWCGGDDEKEGLEEEHRFNEGYDHIEVGGMELLYMSGMVSTTVHDDSNGELFRHDSENGTDREVFENNHASGDMESTDFAETSDGQVSMPQVSGKTVEQGESDDIVQRLQESIERDFPKYVSFKMSTYDLFWFHDEIFFIQAENFFRIPKNA